MTLADYLAVNAKSPDEFAREVGVDPVSVRRYLAGKRLPRWSVLERIMKATAGAVTPNDFVTKAKVRRKSTVGGTCVAA